VIETIRAPCERALRQTSKRTPEHGPPSPRRGTASPPPTGSGDHGGSLGEGEWTHVRIKGKPLSRTFSDKSVPGHKLRRQPTA